MKIINIKTKDSTKDSMSHLFNRYVWLVDLIYRRKGITFSEINKCWRNSSRNDTAEDIPLRTFHNHRRAIEQMFDIIIKCDKQHGYAYYIENAEDMERGGVRNWLLNTFAVNNLINESHKLKQRILFERIPGGQMYLTPIIEAMRDSLSVEITYQSFRQEEAPYTIQVHPYCIKIFKQRWYLIANNPRKSDIRIYALDRIKGLNLTETKFKLPNDFDGDTFFSDCFGIIARDATKVENVLIKVHKDQDSYIRALPLHHSQQEVKSTDTYSIFSYYIKPTYDFRQELLSHGAQVEVLKPKWFRKQIADVILAQHKTYCIKK